VTESKGGQCILRAAVIGTGKISHEHLRFLSSAPGVELSGVCDLSPSLANYAVSRFGAGRAFTNVAEMLTDARPDVVHVLTPPHTHVQLVSDCLNAGAHVIVEKPIALSNGEFHQLWDLARSRGKLLVEDHNYRFNEPVLEMDRLLKSGRLGQVREVEVRMSLAVRAKGSRYMDANLPHPSHKLPAGVLHEFISHLCYLTLHFLPSYNRVAAAWSKQGDDDVFKYDDLDALLLGPEAHGRIRFSAHTAPDTFTITVRGTKGWAETDLFQPHVRTSLPRNVGQQLTPLANQFIGGCTLMWSSIRGFKNKIMQKTPYEGLGRFLVQTYDALRNGGEPPVTFADMDKTSKLIDALLAPENQIGGGCP
jgi:predicted dehydrogenase